MSNKEIDIHMSDLDEETKRILAQVDSDESKDKPKIDKKKKANDDYNEYETNTLDSKDEDW